MAAWRQEESMSAGSASNCRCGTSHFVTSTPTGGRDFQRSVTPKVVTEVVPAQALDCRVIAADYTAMCELLGRLDFHGFCAGYLDHSTWLSMREAGGRASRTVAAVKSGSGGERRQSASYAS
jgi:hypothetical protein